MGLRPPILIASVLIAVLAATPAALAGTPIPPGNSGADQYTEGVPGAGGNIQVGPGNGPASSDGSGADGSEASDGSDPYQGVAEGGTVDAAAAAALSATSPPQSGAGNPDEGTRNGEGAGGGDGGPRGGGGAGDDRSSLSQAIKSAVSGEDGSGPALPIFMIVTLVAAVAVLLARRRNSPPSATS